MYRYGLVCVEFALLLKLRSQLFSLAVILPVIILLPDCQPAPNALYGTLNNLNSNNNKKKSGTTVRLP